MNSSITYCGVAVCSLLVTSNAWAGEDRTSMIFPGKEWTAVPPQEQGVSPRRLNSAIAYLESLPARNKANELFIVRRGRLIHAGPEVDEVHGIWSCTKSFTSTVLGLLIDDGKCSLDSRAAEWNPALAASYPDVTLRHFATMTSGYRAVGDEPRGGYRHGPSNTPLRPDPTPLFAPGAQYAYWDSAMNQFAHVLTIIAQEPLDEFFRRRIADPIQMNPQRWRWGDFGEVDGMRINGGSGNNDRHIFISAREIARFGHLVLNDGIWDGKRLIDADWLAQATVAQVPVAGIGCFRDSAVDARGTYGLNWRTNGITTTGKRKWPGVPTKTFAASGHNNNDMFIIPDWEMVVVRLGLDQSDHTISDEEHASFLRRIGQAIVD